MNLEFLRLKLSWLIIDSFLASHGRVCHEIEVKIPLVFAPRPLQDQCQCDDDASGAYCQAGASLSNHAHLAALRSLLRSDEDVKIV